MTGRIGHAVLELAGIGRRAEIDEQMAFVVDGERMHRMIAGERQPRDDDLRTFLRRDAIGRQRIADDLVVLFGVEAVLVDANAGAAGRALRDAVAEPLDLVGVAVTLRVLERDQKTAGRHFVVVIVGAAPGVYIQNTVGAEGHLPCVAEIVGEHRCAKAGRQRDAAIAAGAAIALPLRGRGVFDDCAKLAGARPISASAMTNKEAAVGRATLARWRM